MGLQTFTEQQTVYGIGAIYGIRLDQSGPVTAQFGVMHSATIRGKWKNEELRGQFQFPLTTARGDGEITVEVDSAQIYMQQFQDLYFAQTLVGGEGITSDLERQTVPTSPGPYTIQVNNFANFIENISVFYGSGLAAGQRLQQVGSAPSGGQYTVNNATGVYTFNSGDAGKLMLISYRYATAARGYTVLIANQLMGVTPTCRLVIKGNTVNPISANPQDPAFMLILNRCVADSIDLPMGRDKFMIPKWTFRVLDDGTGNIGQISSIAL
jgi:hypothetical protein